MNHLLKQPKTSVIFNGRRKVQSLFTDGTEMVEEFDVITDELIVRKVRRPTLLGPMGPWVTEVGVDEERSRAFNPDFDLLRESTSAPVLTRKDTEDAVVLRIRNLSYPKEVFSVTVDVATTSIVVRTSNKKYFKQIEVPDLARAGLELDASNLTWDMANNTLIITYKKPMSMRIIEAREKQERSSAPAVRLKDDGEPQCPQQ